jgi:hypothetical protein
MATGDYGIKIDCPRCEGERGFWRDGVWSPCITCKTQGKIKVMSMAEARRVRAAIKNPEKVKTKQREKERK